MLCSLIVQALCRHVLLCKMPMHTWCDAWGCLTMKPHCIHHALHIIKWKTEGGWRNSYTSTQYVQPCGSRVRCGIRTWFYYCNISDNHRSITKCHQSSRVICNAWYKSFIVSLVSNNNCMEFQLHWTYIYFLPFLYTNFCHVLVLCVKLKPRTGGILDLIIIDNSLRPTTITISIEKEKFPKKPTS